MRRLGKKPQSLWGSLNIVIVGCWIVPLLLILTIFTLQANRVVEAQMESTIETSVTHALSVVETQIEQAIAESRRATYDRTLIDAATEYQTHGDYSLLYDESTRYLTNEYAHNDMFHATYLIYYDLPNQVIHAAGAGEQDTAQSLRLFKTETLPAVEAVAEQLDTKIGFMAQEGRFFMIRNLVNSNFEPVAILVMECNEESLAAGVSTIVWNEGAQLSLDGQTIYYDGNEIPSEEMGLHYQKDTANYVMGIQSTVEGYPLILRVVVDAQFLHVEQERIYLSLALMVPGCFILLWLVVRFIRRHVARPVRRLMEATDHLAQGDLGYHMEEETSSREFLALSQQINHVSDNLKELFDRNTQEQIALHEAKLKALQSQINPHFLNNTLELINWEARMADNYKVSQMIESLSVMLNAAMARGGSPMVEMGAELSYVDAYLYIIAQRFGDRFTLRRELQEELLDLQVPRLILQPIVENAINHGIAQRSQGEMVLRLVKTEGYYLIDVEHDGYISPSDRAVIDQLLTWNPSDQIEAESGRIGIRNVNLRLKLIYGSESGLTITSPKEGRVLSRITIQQSR